MCSINSITIPAGQFPQVVATLENATLYTVELFCGGGFSQAIMATLCAGGACVIVDDSANTYTGTCSKVCCRAGASKCVASSCTKS